MPRNGSGVYSPPTGTYGVPNTVISSPAYDTFVNDIGAEITNSMNVQGSAPMLAPLNMGAFRIINAASPVAATDVVIKSYADAVVSPGFIMAYATDSSAPTGWLICNGASLSTTTYANLFAAIGYAYGGSGANFNIPDFRGCFLRGFDDGRGLDFQGSRLPGTFQASYIVNHFHAVVDPSHAHGVNDPSHAHVVSQSPHAHLISDPGHAHTVPNSTIGVGTNIQPGSGFNINASTTTSTNATGITGTSAINANVAVNGAFTGIGINAAVTGLAVGNVSTGTVNFAGNETTVQNYPVLWCIKF